VPLMKKLSTYLMVAILLTASPAAGENSWPWGHVMKHLNPRSEPLVDSDLIHAIPLGVGPIVECGDFLEPKISLDTGDLSVDIYFGFSSSFANNTIYLLGKNSRFHPLSHGLVPYKTSISGKIELVPLEAISKKDLPAGTYKLYLLLTPAGKLQAGYILWVTSFKVGQDKQKEYKWKLWQSGPNLRGANVYQRRVYEELDDGLLGTGPIGPPYSQEDFNRLARLGANYVNLSHPGLYSEDPPYILDPEVQKNLDEFIEMARKADLFVVIAFRTGPGRSDFSILREGAGNWFPHHYIKDDVWKDPVAQDAWVEMWKYTAQRYKDDPIVVGYDLMVEPNSNDIVGMDSPAQFYAAYTNSTYDWNLLYPRIERAIRQVDPDTPILIQANGYSSIEWHKWLKRPNCDKIIISVHQYEPFEFTHQEFENARFSYPGRIDLDWDGEEDNFDTGWLDSFLDQIDSISSRTSLPVAVTEFGAMRWVSGAADFLNDEMAFFEKTGANYAIWLWESSWSPYVKEVNCFNFRFGTDPLNKQDIDGNELMQVVETYWKKNIMKPTTLLEK